MGPILGGLAVLAFGGLTGRLAGLRWAPAGALVLALTLPEQYTSRASFSETAAQVLLFGGLSLIVDALTLGVSARIGRRLGACDALAGSPGVRVAAVPVTARGWLARLQARVALAALAGSPAAAAAAGWALMALGGLASASRRGPRLTGSWTSSGDPVHRHPGYPPTARPSSRSVSVLSSAPAYGLADAFVLARPLWIRCSRSRY